MLKMTPLSKNDFSILIFIELLSTFRDPTCLLKNLQGSCAEIRKKEKMVLGEKRVELVPFSRKKRKISDLCLPILGHYKDFLRYLLLI